MITREENERWTRVGAGTPGGEMLRRYWWPIGFSDELKGPDQKGRPKKVKLLAEEFVLFRDGAGNVGMVESQCPHRRAPLEYGRVENDGIRCCYHGWKFDTAGICLETPCEDEGSTLKDRVRAKAYPTQELAGLVFAYIGPAPAPLLPKYDLLVHGSGTRYVWGFTDHCNWLQSAENAADATHLAWLHAGPYPMYAGKRIQADYFDRPYGLDYVSHVDGLPADKCSSVVFPSANRFAGARVEQNGLSRQNMLFRVPADDTTTHNVFVSVYPVNDGALVHKTGAPPDRPFPGSWMPTERGIYPPGDEAWWGVHSAAQDRMVQEGQGPVYDRTTESLAGSDRGVVLFRRMLRESIDAVAQGRDPKGIIRDSAQNTVIEFGTRLHKIEAALQVVE
jgi:5,5'-dehydrodivanillate O-demethylase oxygenase subunit